MTFNNDEVEATALELYKAFNPEPPAGSVPDFGPMPFMPPTPEHIDDVFDGGRYRKLAKYVLSNFTR